MSYNGQNMPEYVDLFASLSLQLDRTGEDGAIPESHKAPMLRPSADPKFSWASTATALTIKAISELTSDSMAITVNDEYSARQMRSRISGWLAIQKNKNKSDSYFCGQSRSANSDDIDDNTSDYITLNDPAGHLYAAGSEAGYHWASCDRGCHTHDRCHMNPDHSHNYLPRAILKLVELKAVAEPTRSGKSSQKASKVEIARVATEK